MAPLLSRAPLRLLTAFPARRQMSATRPGLSRRKKNQRAPAASARKLPGPDIFRRRHRTTPSSSGRPGMKALSPDGFAERFTASAGALWCIAVAILGDRHLAEDVLQEAAVIALGKLDAFDPASSFTAWMGQIVRYVALNQFRRRAAARTTPVDPVAFERTVAEARAPIAAVSGGGALVAPAADFDDRVIRALGTLDETARACLLMRVLVDLPYRQIAQALSIPEGTAMSHVHRARAVLSER